MNLLLFLAVGGGRRRIAEVWHSDGRGEHKRVYAPANGLEELSTIVAPAEFAASRRAVDDLLASGARTIREVRARLFLK